MILKPLFLAESAQLSRSISEFNEDSSKTKVLQLQIAIKSISEWLTPLWECKAIERTEYPNDKFWGVGVGGVPDNIHHGTESISKLPCLVKIEKGLVFPRLNFVCIDFEYAIADRFAPTYSKFNEFAKGFHSHYFGYNKHSEVFEIDEGIDRFQPFFLPMQSFDHKGYTPIILSNHLHDKVYFHWFSGPMYILHVLNEIICALDNPILIVTYDLADWQIESIKFFFPKLSPLIAKFENPTLFRNLVYMVGEAAPATDGHYLSYLHRRAKEAKVYERNLKLMVTRNDSKGRRLLNQRELNSCLAKFGYQVVTLSDYEYETQISLIRASTHLVFIDGSSVFNLIYAKRRVSIGLIMIGADSDWRAIANNFGHSDIKYTLASKQSNQFGDFDLHLPTEKLQTLLSEME